MPSKTEHRRFSKLDTTKRKGEHKGERKSRFVQFAENVQLLRDRVRHIT